MFVSTSSRCLADRPFLEACAVLTDLGFDKVELWMDETGGHLKTSELVDDLDGFASRLRDNTRLTPVAFHLGDDVSPEVLGGLCRAAKLLRVAQITVPASPLGTPFNTEIDRLREYVGIGGENGIRISVKTQIGHLSEDPHTAVELCQSVRGLGLTLDPSHFVCGTHSGESFDQVFPYVYHVHLRDSSQRQLQVPVGLGEIDYNRLISQLQKENYRLALSVDLDGTDLDADALALEMRKLRMLLDSLL
ncbi:MAG: sugar phosphate isomerase/epimerase family protein [Planctomycetaceae bacterium]